MKFTISREQFLQPLQLVSGAIERRHTLPILSNILLVVKDGVLTLTGTDLEVELISHLTLSPDSFEDGEITVPAKKLVDICRGLSDGNDITFQVDGNKATIRAGRGRYTLSTLSASDYPNLEDWQADVEFVISQNDLKHLIDSTSFAMAQQDVRYYLNGMSLETEDNNIRTVATDGHRLARVEMPLPEGAHQMPPVIVPRKAVVEIRKLIEDNESDVSISLSESKLCCTIGDTVLTTKLIDGTFPDYERVIPTGNDKIMNVNCRELAEVVDRVATISTEKSRSVKLQLKTRTLVLSANSPESGTAREELEVQYDSDDLEIGFNSRYLLDITNQIEGENIEFSLADPGSPTIVRDQDDNTSLYVLMPMRV